jgi:hypothetical protein
LRPHLSSGLLLSPRDRRRETARRGDLASAFERAEERRSVASERRSCFAAEHYRALLNNTAAKSALGSQWLSKFFRLKTTRKQEKGEARNVNKYCHLYRSALLHKMIFLCCKATILPLTKNLSCLVFFT